MDSSSNDIFAPEHMSDFAVFARQVMLRGAHRYVLRSLIQIIEWCMELESMQEEVPSCKADPRVEVAMRTAILEVKSIPLHRTRAPGNYQNDRRKRTPPHISR